MIVPYVAAVSYDVCRAVPRSQRERRPGPGRDALADDLVGRPALRPARHHRRLLPGPGPGPGRDDGRHHADRQQARHPGPFALGNSIASVIANEFTEADLRPLPVGPGGTGPCCCWSAWWSTPWPGC